MSVSEIGKGTLIEYFLVVMCVWHIFLSGISMGWVGGRESLHVPSPHLDQKQQQLFSIGFCAPSTWSIDNLKSHPAMPDQSPCLLPGFRVLKDFLGHHVHIPEVYLIVSTFFLQTPLTELTDGPKVGFWGTPGIEWHTWSHSVWPRQFPKTLPRYLYPLLPTHIVFSPASFPHRATPLSSSSGTLSSWASASHPPCQQVSVFSSPTFKSFPFWAWLEKSHDHGHGKGGGWLPPQN